MTMRAVSVTIALLVAVALAGQRTEGREQTMPAQVRDAATPVGTGVISGIVMTDEPTPRPIRRASVALAFSSRFPLTTVTDDAGRFAFAELAAGNYTLIGSKPAWVSTYYGGKVAGHGPGVPIALLDGQRVTSIVVKMMHGGSITGVVRRPSGQPANGLNVQAFQVETIAGNRRMSQVPMNMTTDDRGAYRIFGLAPGDYVVQVGSASIGSFQGEMRQVSEAEVRWADQIAANAAAMTSPPPAPGPTLAYAPVFYPGTADPSAASVVSIGPGEERAGVDFTISMVQTAHVSGTVLDENGQPFSNGTVNILPTGAQSDQQGILAIVAAGFGTRPNPNGMFSISNVAPGQYTLRVRASPRPANGANAPNAAMADAIRLLGVGAPGSPTLWAETVIGVDGRDITDVVLRLQPGMTVTGKIVYDGTAAPPADITQTRFGLTPPPTGTSAMELITSSMFGGTMAKVATDGTFVVDGMTPGKYRASVAAPMTAPAAPTVSAIGPWTLKSAMANGRDIADVPLEIRPNEDVSGLVVTFTDRPTELAGSVIDAANRPVTGFPILVFSTDRTYWTIGSRRIQQAQPASDGRYLVSGLPPGEYFVCAVTSFTPNQLYDPAFLESMVPGAFKITLGDGEKKRQDLKLAGGQ